MSFLISTEAFAASSSLAHSAWPFAAASCSGVAPQHRRSGARRQHRRSPLSSRAVAAHDAHGGAVRQEKRDHRRVAGGAVLLYCQVQR